MSAYEFTDHQFDVVVVGAFPVPVAQRLEGFSAPWAATTGRRQDGTVDLPSLGDVAHQA